MHPSSRKLKHGQNNKSNKHRQYEDTKTEEMAKLINNLARSGNKFLDSETVTEVVNICKGSERHAAAAFCMTMEQLEQRHAEIRLSAFQLIDELFRRVPSVRTAVVRQLERVLDLTTGADPPKPVRAARDLRVFTLLTLREWSAVFGRQYLRLNVACEYLCNEKKVDFDALARERAPVEVDPQRPNGRTAAQQRRVDPVAALRVKRIVREIQDKEEDIRTTAVSLTNCINLLLPHPDDFFIVSDDDEESTISPIQKAESDHRLSAKGGGVDPWISGSEESEGEGDGDACLREVGMANVKHSIQLEFTPGSEALILETEENAAIIENARESAKLIGNKYLPAVKAWLQVLSKSSEHEEKSKELNELRGELEDLQFKFGRLKFGSVNSDSDSDFEEVPENVESVKGESSRAETTGWSILPDERTIGDPASAARLKVEPTEERESKPSTSAQSADASQPTHLDRKRKLLAVAPKRPFDVDLYHWEDETLPTPTMIPSGTEGHRFWAAADGCASELPVPEGTASLRTRVIEFSGQFAPVTRSCRARLPSGKLCPRRDRVKCPFHGEIVPRDETGRCANAEDGARLQAVEERRQQERPDWQHPRLLADIKRATGIDLKMPEKGKRKKRKSDQPGLTNLKEMENTSVKRLEKKIFNKAAMRRVASALDRADQRKFNDKFADQFNYFFS